MVPVTATGVDPDTGFAVLAPLSQRCLLRSWLQCLQRDVFFQFKGQCLTVATHAPITQTRHGVACSKTRTLTQDLVGFCAAFPLFLAGAVAGSLSIQGSGEPPSGTPKFAVSIALSDCCLASTRRSISGSQILGRRAVT
jgi:hypothetical protein